MVFVILAGVCFVLYVIGIPLFGIITLHHFMPGIHFDPKLPINEFNPVAGRDFKREDRAELLQLKLEGKKFDIYILLALLFGVVVRRRFHVY